MFTFTYLTGVKILEPEFNWIGRKTIRGIILKYKYYIHTPYLKMGPFDSWEEAYCYKAMFK